MAKLGLTWPQRNAERLQKTKDTAIKLGMQHPTILEIGPGGLVHFLAPYFPSGKRKEWDIYDLISYKILRNLEPFVRLPGLFQLRTTEPEEIVDVFRDLEPKEIYVVDCEPRVIDAAKRKVESLGLGNLFDFHCMDVASGQMPYKADIVLAYRVIPRTNNPRAALENIASSVKSNGILSLNEDATNLPGFTRLSKGLYVRQY